MLPDLARFLQHINVFFADLRVRIFRIVLIDKLRQAQCASHASRPAADDDNGGRHLGTFDGLGRFAKNDAQRLIAEIYRMNGSTRPTFTASLRSAVMNSQSISIARAQ